MREYLAQPFNKHCVQLAGPPKNVYQSWPQTEQSLDFGKSGETLGGAANEHPEGRNNAKIVKIRACKALPHGATALMAVTNIGTEQEILVDYGESGFEWQHRRKATTPGDQKDGGM